jgi:PleD family two-component response regulator
VSVGIASYCPGERVENVIQHADSALYRAKPEGRDQFIVASKGSARDLINDIG